MESNEECRIFDNEKSLEQHLRKQKYFDIWEILDNRSKAPKIFYKYYAWGGWNTYDDLDLLYEEISSGTEHGVFQIYDCENHTSTYVQKEDGWLTRSFKYITSKEAQEKLTDRESKHATLNTDFHGGIAP